MKRYEKKINGKNVIKFLNEIVVKHNGLCTYNPREDMVLKDGWKVYKPKVYEPTQEELLEQTKKRKIEDLFVYDSSESINCCIIHYNGEHISYWANKTERDTLKGVLRDYIELGKDKYRLDLRNIGLSLWIPCTKLFGMLSRLEIYASECYNKTTDHEFAIKALATCEEVESYDFYEGYPEKVEFNLEE